jgi:hypothetical protein
MQRTPEPDFVRHAATVLAIVSRMGNPDLVRALSDCYALRLADFDGIVAADVLALLRAALADTPDGLTDVTAAPIGREPRG